MDFKNRLGDDGISWWIGVVEDRFDPLEAGRCKVRIFGVHTDNLDELPTKNLPWASIVYTPNLGRSFSAPMEGDWVKGIFLDGDSKQAPVITGVFASIPYYDTFEEGRGFSPLAKFYNDTEQKAQAANTTPIVYSDTPAQKILRAGKPTTPAIAYTKEGTALQKADNNRAHVCDIRQNILLQNAIREIKNLQVVQAAIATVQALTDSTAGSPVLTEIRSVVQTLRAFVKTIQKILAFVNDVVRIITQYIALVRQMIAWLLSLPAYLLKMLQDCVVQLQNSLLSSVSLSLDSSQDSILAEVQGLVKDVLGTANQAIITFSNTQAVAESAQRLADPKTYGRP